MIDNLVRSVTLYLVVTSPLAPADGISLAALISLGEDDSATVLRDTPTLLLPSDAAGWWFVLHSIGLASLLSHERRRRCGGVKTAVETNRETNNAYNRAAVSHNAESQQWVGAWEPSTCAETLYTIVKPQRRRNPMEKSLFIPSDFTLNKGWNFGNVVSVPNTKDIERITFLSFPLFGIHAKLFP